MKRGIKNRKNLLIYLWNSLEKKVNRFLSNKRTKLWRIKSIGQLLCERCMIHFNGFEYHFTSYQLTGFLPGKDPRLKPIETTTSGKFSSTDPTSWWKELQPVAIDPNLSQKSQSFIEISDEKNELKSDLQISLLDIFHLVRVGLFFSLF